MKIFMLTSQEKKRIFHIHVSMSHMIFALVFPTKLSTFFVFFIRKAQSHTLTWKQPLQSGAPMDNSSLPYYI